MHQNLYQTLGVSTSSNFADIKSAYRELVKKHHPDAGGDQKRILSINAAWEILRDPEKRARYDYEINQKSLIAKDAEKRGFRNACASNAAKAMQTNSAKAEDNFLRWFKDVYTPINRLLGEIINPFQSQIRDLSADPYDDKLMANFCLYIETSRKRIQKIHELYKSQAHPINAKDFALNLYHCLSQVEDAVNELDRYTMGYVDNYLNDGREMLQKAKKRRQWLQKERHRLTT